MRKNLLGFSAALLALLPLTFSAAPAQNRTERTEALRDAALEDDIAWDIVEGLTTEIGPRLAGTEAEARARVWAVAKLKALGFKNVHVEEFSLPVWVRGEEQAEIVSPFPQKLAVAALGNSAATPAQGITAQVIGFRSVDELRAAPEGSLAGKIAYVSHQMRRTQDGSGYGFAGPARWNAPSIAASKGAVGIVIKSIGTDYHRNPHTGGTNWAVPGGGAAGNAVNAAAGPPAGAIPAGALSLPDAEQLERMLDRDRPITMKLTLTPRWLGQGTSGNVVAEVPGSDPKAGVVLIGGHLDSWDLATGAFDNAAGVAITAAAAKRIMDAGRPRRTIRVVWFGSEEVGVFGGRAYYERHKNDGNIAFVSESDFGADKVWRMRSRFAPGNAALADAVHAAIASLGITRDASGTANAGADLGAWATAGIAAIDLNQDGTRYFDLHHTPDDTLDKIDPDQLRQNVAAWTAMLSIIANAEDRIAQVTN